MEAVAAEIAEAEKRRAEIQRDVAERRAALEADAATLFTLEQEEAGIDALLALPAGLEGVSSPGPEQAKEALKLAMDARKARELGALKKLKEQLDASRAAEAEATAALGELRREAEATAEGARPPAARASF